MGILHAFWKSFDDVFANKYAFVMPIVLITITMLMVYGMNYLISGQSCPVSVLGNVYQSSNSCTINLPLFGSITALGLVFIIVLALLTVLMVVLSSLVYVSQGYDIMKNKTLSVKRSVGMALRKLPVAYVSNLIVILLYLATYAVIGLVVYLMLTKISMIYNVVLPYLMIVVMAALGVMLIIVSVYYSLLFYFINAVIVAEGKGVLSSIVRSVELSRQRKTKIFGAVTLSDFIIVMATLLAYLPIILLTGSFGLGIFGGSLLGTGGIFTSSGALMIVFGYITPIIILLVSYMFILSWLGMVPMYLYNEFTFNIVKPLRGKRQDTDQSQPMTK